MQIPALGGIHVLWLQWTNSHGQLSPVEEKGQLSHSQEERASSLVLTGFYCFSGHITLWMILIYYAQVRFRRYLLQKTKERMLLIT